MHLKRGPHAPVSYMLHTAHSAHSSHSQFNPRSWYVTIAGFVVSPCTATRMSPLSVGTRRRSHAPTIEPRWLGYCSWTERSSMSSIGSTGIALRGQNKEDQSGRNQYWPVHTAVLVVLVFGGDMCSTQDNKVISPRKSLPSSHRPSPGCTNVRRR